MIDVTVPQTQLNLKAPTINGVTKRYVTNRNVEPQSRTEKMHVILDIHILWVVVVVSCSGTALTVMYFSDGR
jgi:hypothetical protein